MLDEMEQVICRLHRLSLSSSWAVQQLTGLHKQYLHDLERIASSQEHPHVMRILAEECVEHAQGIMDAIGVGTKGDALLEFPYWRCYLNAIQAEEIMDLELMRHRAAKKLADLFLKNSYMCEDSIEYKRMRYEYALSTAPLPKWFRREKVMGWLEEIITADCFLWFAVMDYIEEICRSQNEKRGA